VGTSDQARRVTDSSAPRFGVLLTVAYDGALYSGWAKQPGARTIAGELEGAIAEIDPHASTVRGVSRTDAGVHARGQVASFDTNLDIPARGWALGLAPHLPREIAVMEAARVPPGFDPRNHVTAKTYRYLLLSSPTRDPFLERRAWRVGHRLNQKLIQPELDALVGEHDFAAFRGSADQRTETVRQILRGEVRSVRSDPRCWEIEIEGNRFLYHMVRIIIGTVIDVARGRLEPGATRRALESLQRGDLGATAPPDGLYLDRVDLDIDPSDRWPSTSSAD